MDTHYSVKCPTGRLIVSHLVSLATVEEAQALRAEARLLAQACKQKVVICADWSQTTVFPPVVADVIASMLTTANEYIERSAVLLAAKHATFNLQVERLVREAAVSNRRTFRDKKMLFLWLEPVLTIQERNALSEFLGVDNTR